MFPSVKCVPVAMTDTNAIAFLSSTRRMPMETGRRRLVSYQCTKMRGGVGIVKVAEQIQPVCSGGAREWMRYSAMAVRQCSVQHAYRTLCVPWKWRGGGEILPRDVCTGIAWNLRCGGSSRSWWTLSNTVMTSSSDKIR